MTIRGMTRKILFSVLSGLTRVAIWPWNAHSMREKKRFSALITVDLSVVNPLAFETGLDLELAAIKEDILNAFTEWKTQQQQRV